MIFYICNSNELAPTQADARAIDKDFVQIDIPVDKAGLMAFINNLYAQIWAKEDPEEALYHQGLTEPEEPLPPPPPPAVPYSIKSAEIDAVFQNLPLGHQLTLAGLALEKARESIRC